MSMIYAFMAGIATVLSPCILPLLPVVLASSTLGGKSRPYGLVIGFAVFFTIITLLLSLLVRQFSISADIHRTLASIIFISLGVILAVPAFKGRFEIVTSRLTAGFSSAGKSSSGFSGGFLTGAGLGLAWTPCVGPIMASVITLALNQETTLASGLTAIAFSLGTAIPMGLCVVFGNKIYRHVGFLKRHSARIQQGMGIFIILVGLAIWFGFDRTIQIALFQLFPNWDAALTGWERSVTN